MSLPNESNLLTTVFIGDWAKTLSVLETHPNPRQTIERIDAHGRNASHRACYRREAIPLDVFRSLLSRASPNATLRKDACGRTPLHRALRYSSEDVILKLIEKAPGCVEIEDDEGWTPLHYALHWNRSLEVLHNILRVCPEAAMAINDRGQVPLFEFFRAWEDRLSESLLSYEDRDLKDADGTVCAGTGEVRSVQEIYDVTVLFLRAALYGKLYDTSSGHMLHAALQVDYFPRSFFELLLKFHPEQVKQTDEKGNLPLHVAAAAANGAEISKIIGTLLQSYPDAAKTLNRDRKLPLHLAIESNKDYEMGGVKELVYADPRALRTSDLKTRLLPFMLAATTVESSKEGDVEEEVQQVNNVYSLLREDPSFLSWMVCSE